MKRLTLLLVVVLILILSPVVASASTTISGLPVACGMSQRLAQQASGGVQVLSRPNPFDDSGQQLCIQGAPYGRPGFTVLSNLRYTGAWQAYPFTGAGCAYYLCSGNINCHLLTCTGTDLPKQVSKLPATANTSFSWHGPAPGNWNASYDIWFDKHDQYSTEDNGAELMIWLKPNTSLGHGAQLVSIGGRLYWFVHWRTCDRAGTCWNYLQFRFTGPWLARHGMWMTVHSIRGLRLVPFVHFLENRGLMSPSWWLTSVHAGYEIVSGGKGLTTTWFNWHG